MQSHKFRIVEEFSIKIAHALMTHRDARLSEVDTIMSHPQVLGSAGARSPRSTRGCV